MTTADAARWFPTSALKIVVLTLVTVGLYQLYWFYKNWWCHKERTGENLFPLRRAVFAPLFCYQLFRRINDDAAHVGARTFRAVPLAATCTVLLLCGSLPDPYWLISFLSVLPIVRVQRVANAINAKASQFHDPNTRFTGWNWVAVFLGMLLFVMAAMGSS